jgi:uncharacterized membrane protein
MRAQGALLVAGLVMAAQAFGCGSPDPVTNCPNDLPMSCPSPAPSFAGEVNAIIQDRCATCHAPGQQSPTLPMQTYDQILALALHRGMLNQVSTCRMPLAGGPPLTTDERQVLMAWLVCGAPNN